MPSVSPLVGDGELVLFKDGLLVDDIKLSENIKESHVTRLHHVPNTSKRATLPGCIMYPIPAFIACSCQYEFILECACISVLFKTLILFFGSETCNEIRITVKYIRVKHKGWSIGQCFLRITNTVDMSNVASMHCSRPSRAIYSEILGISYLPKYY